MENRFLHTEDMAALARDFPAEREGSDWLSAICLPRL